MERVVFISWKNVSLVIPEKEDLEVMYSWINNLNISKFLGPIKHYTKVQEERFLDSVLNWEHKLFVIMENSTKEIIWWVSFNEFSENNRNWLLWITLYREDKMSKWYWSEALKLFLKYSFEYIWLNKVKLRVFCENSRAIKLYEKCWFKKVWTLKEEVYVMWEYKDEYIMEIMRGDYLALNK